MASVEAAVDVTDVDVLWVLESEVDEALVLSEDVLEAAVEEALDAVELVDAVEEAVALVADDDEFELQRQDQISHAIIKY